MFDKILKFERALAEFTGAPYAIMTASDVLADAN